jgi:Flp pilus assembly secretin CpaC
MTTSLSSPRSSSRAALLAGLTLFAGIALAATQARASDLVVKYDQSQLLRLPRPAAEIIIGNPAIADVSIQTGNLLVITGKSFGITNIIALDAERNVIQDQRVMVRRDEAGVVNLMKGSSRSTYNCAAVGGAGSQQCNPSIMVGDDLTYFQQVRQASEAKIQFSERAADAAAQAGNQ